MFKTQYPIFTRFLFEMKIKLEHESGDQNRTCRNVDLMGQVGSYPRLTVSHP